MARHGPEPALIPLFPLHTVLFPGAMLPLNVFEERYRLLVAERLDFGVVLIRRGSEVGPGRAEDLYPVGTLATMHRVEALPDGRFAVVARGLHRFQLLALDHGRPYLRARVEQLSDPPPRASPRLVRLLERYLAVRGVEVAPQLSPALGKHAVWLVGTVLEVEPALRQRLLESGDPSLAEAMLAEELAKEGRIGRMRAVRPRPPVPN
jgi:Lon protease-like protein